MEKRMKKLLILSLLLLLVILVFGQTAVRPKARMTDGENIVYDSRPGLPRPSPQTAAERPAQAVEKSVDVGGFI